MNLRGAQPVSRGLFEIFAWGGDTPGAMVQEWTYERVRKWTPPRLGGPHAPLLEMYRILHFVIDNQQPRTKIILFTNLAWLIALVRGTPVVFPGFRGIGQDNPIPTLDEAGQSSPIIPVILPVLRLVSDLQLSIHPVMLEHHPYYEIPFASSEVTTVRAGVDCFRFRFIVPLTEDPEKRTYTEGKYMDHH